MTKVAHPKIQEMIDLAERDIRKLQAAKTSKKARLAWISFLENANRAFNRLEGYSKHTGQFDKFHHLRTNEIWENGVTKYMREARNANEHGIEELSVDDHYNTRIVFPNGYIMGTPQVFAKNPDGQLVALPQLSPFRMTSSSPGAKQVSLNPGIRMLPITNKKGETIMPPAFIVAGRPDESEAVAAAKEYLRWIIEQVGKFD